MKVAFEPKSGLIIVRVTIHGPERETQVNLALDTGATTTLINSRTARFVGYKLADATGYLKTAMGNGEEYMPQITVARIESLGQNCEDFPVVIHTLPASTGVDGLLGLDFLRGRVLNLDFANGQLELS